jgi:hypothetical protein
MEARYRADGSVKVSFVEADDNTYSRDFIGELVRSTSGIQYNSTNGRFMLRLEGDEGVISRSNGEVIFLGIQQPAKNEGVLFLPTEAKVSGRLVLGHKSHSIQPCGASEVFWIDNADGPLFERYRLLTAHQAPYTAVYAELTGTLMDVDTETQGFAADYSQILTVDQVQMMAPIENHPECGTGQLQATLYFSRSEGVWRDHVGICHTCTPENGFGPDGNVDNIRWRELRLSLKNDAGETPDLDEVRDFFQSQYAEQSGTYPVHLTLSDDIFLIQIPVPKVGCY